MPFHVDLMPQQSKQTGTTGERAIDRPPRPSTTGRSADDIREGVKETVAKGVSAVAGAVEGVDSTMQDTQLGETAESAVHQVGQTVNKAAKAVREETDELKQAFKPQGGSSSAKDESIGDETVEVHVHTDVCGCGP